MIQRPTLVRIASPCPASWDAMTPTATGRHCAACQKTVVDFTQKTDAEILVALRQATGQICGRLRPDQLARPLAPTAEASRWRSWLGAALALGGVLGAGRAGAQTRNYYAGPQPLASPTGRAISSLPDPSATPAALAAVANGPATLRGTVTDAATHVGLPGVMVLLKGTNLGASTDADGNFALTVPASAAPVQLTFSFIGFASQERTVVAPGSQPLAVALAADTHMLLGEVVITNVQRPWPWHPRSFFNWSKYWITKPFQK